MSKTAIEMMEQVAEEQRVAIDRELMLAIATKVLGPELTGLFQSRYKAVQKWQHNETIAAIKELTEKED